MCMCQVTIRDGYYSMKLMESRKFSKFFLMILFILVYVLKYLVRIQLYYILILNCYKKVL